MDKYFHVESVPWDMITMTMLRFIKKEINQHKVKHIYYMMQTISRSNLLLTLTITVVR